MSERSPSESAKPAGARHTPGPWRVEIGSGMSDEDGEWDSLEIVPHHGQSILAELHSRSGDANDAAEQDANARLIAAAPLLLDELEALVRSLRDGDGPHWSSLIAGASAALAAARPDTARNPKGDL